MIASYSPSAPANPHKRRRLSPSDNQSSKPYRSSFSSSHQPHLDDLANDRLVSRNKLQSTWEDIIQKYSTIPSDEVDEIDLETEEIVVDHGHIKSLRHSSLWDPLDSEKDDDETESIAQSAADSIEYDSPAPQPNDQDKKDPKLPSEEEIIKQFGEQYGKDILAFLKQRTTLPNKNSKAELWMGPADEEEIFKRAKDLWKKVRLNTSSPTKTERTFDKESFERAIFGFGFAMGSQPEVSDSTEFLDAIFGQTEKEEIGQDETKGVGKANTSFEDLVFGQFLGGTDHASGTEQRTTKATGTRVVYTIDSDTDDSPPPNERRFTTSRASTPKERYRTPSVKSEGRRSVGLSAHGRDRIRGNVVSGLLGGDGSDDENHVPASHVNESKVSQRERSQESPLSNKARLRTTSSSPGKRHRSENVQTKLSDDNFFALIDIAGKDTQDKCGEKGYRCNKAFCFQCIP